MATKEEILQLVASLKEMEEELDEFLTDKFADLEMALDARGLKDNPPIFKIWDRASDHQLAIAKDLKQLRKLLKKVVDYKRQNPLHKSSEILNKFGDE